MTGDLEEEKRGVLHDLFSSIFNKYQRTVGVLQRWVVEKAAAVWLNFWPTSLHPSISLRNEKGVRKMAKS